MCHFRSGQTIEITGKGKKIPDGFKAGEKHKVVKVVPFEDTDSEGIRLGGQASWGSTHFEKRFALSLEGGGTILSDYVKVVSA